MFLLQFVNFIVLQFIYVSGVTDAPRPNLFSTDSKEISDFDVPISLVGAETLALQSANNQKLANHQISRSVAYSLPFDHHHFTFNHEDWTVYNVPNSEYEQMIVSSPTSDIAKELTIATTIKAKSSVIIRYQAHLTSEDTPVKPSLSVFLISNGMRTHLKEETPSLLWSNSSIKVNTDTQSELLFVGILRATGNQIALRSFSFEILSQTAFMRYAAPPSEEQGLQIPEETDIPNFQMAPGPEYNIFTGNNIQGDSSQSVPELNNEDDVKYMTNNNETFVHEDSSIYNESSVESSNVLVNFSSSNNFPTGMDNYSDFQNSANISDEGDIGNFPGYSYTPSNELVPAAGSHSDIIPPYTKSTTPIPSQNSSSSSSSSSESTTESSGTNGVVNFFIILTVSGLIVVGLLWWRHRRNRPDDEIPVFSRSATEHGNPTFLDDETHLDPGLSSESQANYRSFQ